MFTRHSSHGHPSFHCWSIRINFAINVFPTIFQYMCTCFSFQIIFRYIRQWNVKNEFLLLLVIFDAHWWLFRYFWDRLHLIAICGTLSWNCCEWHCREKTYAPPFDLNFLKRRIENNGENRLPEQELFIESFEYASGTRGNEQYCLMSNGNRDGQVVHFKTQRLWKLCDWKLI